MTKSECAGVLAPARMQRRQAERRVSRRPCIVALDDCLRAALSDQGSFRRMAFRAVRIRPSGRLAAQTRRWRSVEALQAY